MVRISKISKAVSISIAIFVFFTAFSITSVKANPSTADTVVSATLEITFSDGVNLSIRARLDAYKIKIFGESYNVSQIRASYDENKGAFKQVLYTYIEEVMNYVFANCTNEIGRPYVDEDSLNGSPNTPVIFYMDCTVSLTSRFFGADILYISDFINGILDAGGEVSYHFKFCADAGWDITYHFITTERMEIVSVNQNGVLSLSGKEVTWTVENKDGVQMKYSDGTFVVRYENPTSKYTSGDAHIDIFFDFREIDRTKLDCHMDIRSCRADFIDLPDFVSDVAFLPSDAIRMLVEQNITTWNNVYTSVFAPVRENIENVMTSSFNPSSNLSFNFNLSTTYNCSSSYNLTHMDSEPPLSANLSGYLNIPLCGVSSRAFFAFIYGGGVGKITSKDISLSGIDYPFDAHIILPDNFNGTAVWNNTGELNTTVSYKNAPRYEEESIARDIEIELKGIDLDLIGILTGKSNVVATMDVKYNQNLYHILPQPEFSIPDCISIPYINSDLLRVCMEEKVFSEENMSNFFNRQREFAEQHLSEIFDKSDIDVYLNKAELEKNLQWDGNIEGIGDDKPFAVPLSSHLSYKTRFNFSLSSFSLDINNQTFYFRGIPGQEVCYRFILPAGVNIKCEDSLNRTVTTPLKDGRTMIEITFSKDEGDAATVLHYSLTTSPVSTALVFLPMIAAFIIVIILLILLFYIRKRKRRLPPAPPREERYMPPES